MWEPVILCLAALVPCSIVTSELPKVTIYTVCIYGLGTGTKATNRMAYTAKDGTKYVAYLQCPIVD